MIGSLGATASQMSAVQRIHRVNASLGQATERLATAKRINRAADDPAGLVSAEQLRGTLIDLRAQADSFAAERRQGRMEQSGRQQTLSVLQDVRSNVSAAAGSVQSTEEKQARQIEVDAAIDSLRMVRATTGLDVPVALESLRSGGSANLVNGDAAESAAITDAQVREQGLAIAAAGAYEKYTLNVGQELARTQAVTTAAALSRIEDADFAKETSEAVKGQILAEAAMQTLRIANQVEAQQKSLPASIGFSALA